MSDISLGMGIGFVGIALWVFAGPEWAAAWFLLWGLLFVGASILAGD